MLFCIGFVFQSWPMRADSSSSAMKGEVLKHADAEKGCCVDTFN